MANSLRIFEQSEFGSVRIHIDDRGEPWFVAKDVCDVLEIEKYRDAVARLDDDERGSVLVDTLGGTQQMATISESGLYSLIFRSRKPEAKAFSKWVRSEVLPAIRKTGGYGAPMSYPDALRALAAEVELREAEKAQRALAEAQRDEAIRTKAEIGSRREATAMATASAAVRKVGALENQLGFGKEYKQVKAIPWLLDVFRDCRSMYQQVGKKLSAISQRMDYEVKKIPCPEYPQGVKAYHVDVVNAFRIELQRDRNMLGRYRLAA